MTKKELNQYYATRQKPVFFTIETDSVKLFCATAGSDTLPPLLLVHGAPGAWYSSRVMLEDSLLQKAFHIIAVDRPGYNNSRFRNKRRSVTSIEIQATAVAEALRLNKSRTKGIVLGSSYGAPIAAEIALRYSESFKHLFLLAAAIDPEKEKFWWFHKYIRRGPAYWILPRFLRIATDEKFSHVQELRRLERLWKQLNMPVTMIQGQADKIVDPSNVEYAKKQFPGKNNEYILIPGEGHMLRFRQSGFVRDVLLKAMDPMN
jgi:pimeloyl-ACP methyl ester carboxylesterase